MINTFNIKAQNNILYESKRLYISENLEFFPFFRNCIIKIFPIHYYLFAENIMYIAIKLINFIIYSK